MNKKILYDKMDEMRYPIAYTFFGRKVFFVISVRTKTSKFNSSVFQIITLPKAYDPQKDSYKGSNSANSLLAVNPAIYCVLEGVNLMSQFSRAGK